ncbi:MAG: hypothetical protein IJE02_03295 [Clostridia bacterium]|nr:hypothetical protein [Clostridia bacterium]
MKNYDETISTVFERIDQYNTARARKRKTITRTVVPAFSVCLAVAIGIFAAKSDAFKSKPFIGEKDNVQPNELNSSSNVIDTPSDDIDGDWYGEGQEPPPSNSSGNSSTNSEQVSDPVKLLCYINQIESTKDSDIAPPHPVDDHYHKDWSLDDATKYLNVDFSVVNAKYVLDSSNCGAWYKKSDNTLVMDHNAFVYTNEKGSYLLEASKTFVPGDCIVVPENEVVSTIVGTKNGPVYVKFYGTIGSVMSHNYSSIQTTMIAEFEHKGVNFRIEANDISAFAFYQFVSAVANG